MNDEWNNETSQNDHTNGTGGEYRFVPAEHETWSDAGYVPSRDAAAVPKCYSYNGASGDGKREDKKSKKARRGVPWPAAIALVLVCAILGGVAGAYGPALLNSAFGTETAGETVRATPVEGTTINVAATAAPTVTTTQVTTGSELSATDIYYNLAVNQAVAITTEITYTNAWGYTTSGAVKGSGFIISSDGYILTNYHVIEDAVSGGYDIEVLMYDGTEYIAPVIGYEADNDVALLKIDAEGLTPVTLGNSDELLVGQQVYAVGNPLGELEFSMSEGMVSATDREITTSDSSTGRAVTINMFQTTAAINSGNSGGPVYNSRGEVVGIASAKYSSTGVEGLGFAIPINDAVRIATDLITDGYVRGKASIGVTVESISASAAQYYGVVPGAIVRSVTEDSAAEKAGVQVSDIIVALGEIEVSSSSELTAAKKSFTAGDTTTIRVYRSGSYIDLTITFDEEVPGSSGGTTAQEDDRQGGSGDYETYTDPFEYFYRYFGSNPFGR